MDKEYRADSLRHYRMQGCQTHSEFLHAHNIYSDEEPHKHAGNAYAQDQKQWKVIVSQGYVPHFRYYKAPYQEIAHGTYKQ